MTMVGLEYFLYQGYERLRNHAMRTSGWGLEDIHPPTNEQLALARSLEGRLPLEITDTWLEENIPGTDEDRAAWRYILTRYLLRDTRYQELAN